jgi:hypothetical protein
MAADKRKMSEQHEKYLALINDGRKTKSSGNQWDDRNDGRNDRMTQHFAFSWDGKSTTGEGINVTRAMISKAIDHAEGERMQLGLRYYASERLDNVSYDLVAVLGDDWQEVLGAARQAPALQAQNEDLRRRIEELETAAEQRESETSSVREGVTAQRKTLAAVTGELRGAQQEAERLREEAAAARRALMQQSGDCERFREEAADHAQRARDLEEQLHAWDAGQQEPQAAALIQRNQNLAMMIDERDRHLEQLRRQLQLMTNPAAGRGPVEEGTTIIFGMHDDLGSIQYRAQFYHGGTWQTVPSVLSVRVERSQEDTDILILNDIRVRRGELWIDGELKSRAGPGL